MYAVFITGRQVHGYKEIDYEGEEDSFKLPYRLYDSLPDVFSNVPDGHRIEFNEDTEEFEFVSFVPELNLANRVKQLEDEKAILTAQAQRAEAIASATSSDFEAFMDFFFSQF